MTGGIFVLGGGGGGVLPMMTYTGRLREGVSPGEICSSLMILSFFNSPFIRK